jgi:hypothetical protein
VNVPDPDPDPVLWWTLFGPVLLHRQSEGCATDTTSSISVVVAAAGTTGSMVGDRGSAFKYSSW